jgi:hypothetical protein
LLIEYRRLSKLRTGVELVAGQWQDAPAQPLPLAWLLEVTIVCHWPIATSADLLPEWFSLGIRQRVTKVFDYWGGKMLPSEQPWLQFQSRKGNMQQLSSLRLTPLIGISIVATAHESMARRRVAVDLSHREGARI